MGNIRQRLGPTGNLALMKPRSQGASESRAERDGRYSRGQSCVDGSLNAGESAACLTTRDVVFYQVMNLGTDRFGQRVQQCFSSLFAIHRGSPMISPSARRARCRWLFTVPSGIPNM